MDLFFAFVFATMSIMSGLWSVYIYRFSGQLLLPAIVLGGFSFAGFAATIYFAWKFFA